MEKTDSLRYKVFWTWDHSTNWCMNQVGKQNTGVGNYYTKKAATFVEDYKRAVDFCRTNGIDAIGIVGLLRDSHGGLEAARRVCGYAREHGVRIYLITGLFSYGGIYYEGDSEFSLDRFLQKNPECMARWVDRQPFYWTFSNPHGFKRQPIGCPSSKTLHNFIMDSLDYVFHAIPDLGGAQIESGDSFICMCDACRERRAAMRGGEEQLPLTSMSDMAAIYPDAARVIFDRTPDAWVICETYTHFLDCRFFQDPDSPALKAITGMPEQIFWQWKCDKRLKAGTWTEDDRLPEPMRKFRHIMRAHHGTQWIGGRHTLAVDEIRRQCRLSFTSGIQGVSIFGEGSDFHANAEMNYKALNYFAAHPMASCGDFAQDVMAPLLGGNDLALRYLQLGVLNKTPEKILPALPEFAKIIGSLRDPGAIRRWTYLASFLSTFAWEYAKTARKDGSDNVEFNI
ncbi:MAG: hypothetical protein IJS01_14625 [Lentisphaeria bacterium]|nr:hypothetical protein [Lentisphaeria bacterium]